jgi:hypothetical protein
MNVQAPSNKALRGRWRHALFVSWIAASALVALYIGIAGPFAAYLGEGRPFVALALPALMFFMLATGLGWLALLAASRPSERARARH